MDRGAASMIITNFNELLNNERSDTDVFRHFCLSVSPPNKILPAVCIGENVPVVTGVIRRKLGKKCPETICIGNPWPAGLTEELKGVIVPPSFDSVQSLVQARPSIVGNCVMWLMLPSVLAKDTEALVLLDPQIIVARIDTMGSTCSPTFNRWLNQTCCVPAHYKTCYSNEPVTKLVIPSKYELVAAVTTEEIRKGIRVVNNVVVLDQKLLLGTFVLKKSNRGRHIFTMYSLTMNEFPPDLRKMYRSAFGWTCAWCNRPAEAACGGCRIAHYCDAPTSKCQQLDRPSHKHWCKYPLEAEENNE
jgi:MYND finger